MAAENTALEELEKRIGYTFRDRRLLELSVTHSSYVKEHEDAEESNERLEFLGDAFFDAVIGEKLYTLFPEKEEGFLSQARALLVCEGALAKEANRLELGQFLKLGKGEEKNGGRTRRSILADALEAVLGAVYMDGGFSAVQTVVLGIFADAIGQVTEEVADGHFQAQDHKTALQEALQKNGTVDIRYQIIGESGPEHDKTFTVQLVINGEPMTTGEGKSRKKAEQRAAKSMMEKL